MTLFGGLVLEMLGQYGPPATTGAGVGVGVGASATGAASTPVPWPLLSTRTVGVAVGVTVGDGVGLAVAVGDAVAVAVAVGDAAATASARCAPPPLSRLNSTSPSAASPSPRIPIVDHAAACRPGVPKKRRISSTEKLRW